MLLPLLLLTLTHAFCFHRPSCSLLLLIIMLCCTTSHDKPHCRKDQQQILCACQVAVWARESVTGDGQPMSAISALCPVPGQVEKKLPAVTHDGRGNTLYEEPCVAWLHLRIVQVSAGIPACCSCLSLLLVVPALCPSPFAVSSWTPNSCIAGTFLGIRVSHVCAVHVRMGFVSHGNNCCPALLRFCFIIRIAACYMPCSVL